MIWQDVAIMVSAFIAALSLIPSIRGKQKPAKLSCILTVIPLTVVAICFGTLGLWLSFSAIVTTNVMWGILLFQKRT